MAIKIYEKFAPRANPADGDYPYGSIKNESVPGAKDGTPLDAEWGNDYAGFDAELFAQAGVVPSGVPDKKGASQRVDAIKKLEKAASKITNAGGGSVQGFIDGHVTNNLFNALNPKYNIKNDASANADVGFAMLVDDMASAGGGVMFVPAGDYLVKHIDLVTLAKSNIQIIGEGRGITRFIFDSSGGRVTQSGHPSPTFARNNSADGLFYISADVSNQTDDSLSVKNIKFRDLTIDMDVETNGFDELMHAISAFGVSGLDVKYCELKGFLGDGVAVNRGNGTFSYAFNKNVIIKYNSINGVNKDNRNGVSIYYCDGFDVSRNIIINTTRADMPGAIDIEPDDNSKQTASGRISYNLIADIGGNVGAIAILTKSGGQTTTGIDVIGNNIGGVAIPFCVFNTSGGVADTDPMITFRHNTISNYSGAPVRLQLTRDVKLISNVWRNGTATVGAASIIHSDNIKLISNTFDTLAAQDGFIVDGLSSNFKMDDNEFRDMARYAVSINYNNSKVKITNNRFKSTGISSDPVQIGLLSMPSADYTEFYGNVSSGLFTDLNEDKKILLLNGGVYPTTYDAMQPASFPYGTTVFYSVGAVPEAFAGDSNGTVVTVRDKFSPTIMTTKQTFTLRDPTATASYQRFAASDTAWHPWKKVSLGAV